MRCFSCLQKSIILKEIIYIVTVIEAYYIGSNHCNLFDAIFSIENELSQKHIMGNTQIFAGFSGFGPNFKKYIKSDTKGIESMIDITYINHANIV